MNLDHLPPARWQHLFAENGEIDPFLLTPLGSLGKATLQLSAVCGGNPEATSFAELVVVVCKGDTVAMVGGLPPAQVYGSRLSHDDLVITIQFLEQNRTILLAHWIGTIDSIELVMRLTAGSSGL